MGDLVWHSTFGVNNSYGNEGNIWWRIISSRVEEYFDICEVELPGISSYFLCLLQLGAFGWLAGPAFTKAGGLPNAGLHDQMVSQQLLVVLISGCYAVD